MFNIYIGGNDYMKLTHDLKLCDYNMIHSSLMCDKDIEVQE